MCFLTSCRSKLSFIGSAPFGSIMPLVPGEMVNKLEKGCLMVNDDYQLNVHARVQADYGGQFLGPLFRRIVFIINVVIALLLIAPLAFLIMPTNGKQTIEERKEDRSRTTAKSKPAASLSVPSPSATKYILDQCQMCDEQNPWLIKCLAGCGRRGCHIFCVGICVHCGTHRCFDCWTINHCCEAAGQGARHTNIDDVLRCFDDYNLFEACIICLFQATCRLQPGPTFDFSLAGETTHTMTNNVEMTYQNNYFCVTLSVHDEYIMFDFIFDSPVTLGSSCCSPGTVVSLHLLWAVITTLA